MSNTSLIRIGAAAAALFVLAQIASALLLPVEPLWTEDPAEGVRVVADAAGWDAIWLVHLAGALLAIVALAVVGRTFVDGPAREWARVGDVLLALTGAVAVVAVLVGAALEEIADAWATAAPPSREAYLASYDTTHTVWTLVDLGGTVGLGLYLTTFAAAVLSSRVYGRWLGWASAAAAPLIVVGLVVELRSTVGTYVATVGILLFMAVMIGLARALWRRSVSVGHAPLIQAEAGR